MDFHSDNISLNSITQRLPRTIGPVTAFLSFAPLAFHVAYCSCLCVLFFISCIFCLEKKLKHLFELDKYTYIYDRHCYIWQARELLCLWMRWSEIKNISVQKLKCLPRLEWESCRHWNACSRFGFELAWMSCALCLINNSIFLVAELDSCSSDDCSPFHIYFQWRFRYFFIFATFSIRTNCIVTKKLSTHVFFTERKVDGVFVSCKIGINVQGATILHLWCQSCDMFWLDFPPLIVAQRIGSAWRGIK